MYGEESGAKDLAFPNLGDIAKKHDSPVGTATIGESLTRESPLGIRKLGDRLIQCVSGVSAINCASSVEPFKAVVETPSPVTAI